MRKGAAAAATSANAPPLSLSLSIYLSIYISIYNIYKYLYISLSLSIYIYIDRTRELGARVPSYDRDHASDAEGDCSGCGERQRPALPEPERDLG